jgi:hypothetical protein
MGIDGIGKGGKLPPTGGTEGVGSTSKTGATFEVEGAKPTDATSATQHVDATSPLARLKAGEIDVNGYVDLKVDEATKGLQGLPPTDLADLKSMLREKMVSDPGLADLVHQATGHVPSPPEE